MAYWCIANGHEWSQSRLESSLGLFVVHFISDRDLARLGPGLGVILGTHSSISTSFVAPDARPVPRGNLFREKISNRMTTQIVNVKKRLIANGDVPAIRVAPMKWVSILGERRAPIELLNLWQSCLTLLGKLLLTGL